MEAAHERVQTWAEEMERQGKKVDRSSVFVGEAMNYAMSRDPEGKNPQLMNVVDAGAAYVDAYRALQQGGGQ